MTAFGQSFTYSFNRFGDFHSPDNHIVLIRTPPLIPLNRTIFTPYKCDLISILSKINYISENISEQTNSDIITYLKLTLKRAYMYRVEFIYQLNNDVSFDSSNDVCCIGVA
jgi:hypothetical protein